MSTRIFWIAPFGETLTCRNEFLWKSGSSIISAYVKSTPYQTVFVDSIFHESLFSGESHENIGPQRFLAIRYFS